MEYSLAYQDANWRNDLHLLLYQGQYRVHSSNGTGQEGTMVHDQLQYGINDPTCTLVVEIHGPCTVPRESLPGPRGGHSSSGTDRSGWISLYSPCSFNQGLVLNDMNAFISSKKLNPAFVLTYLQTYKERLESDFDRFKHCPSQIVQVVASILHAV